MNTVPNNTTLSEIYPYSPDSLDRVITPLPATLTGPTIKDGSELFRGLMEIARDEPSARIALMISPANETMQAMCEKLGFALSPSNEMGMTEAIIEF